MQQIYVEPTFRYPNYWQGENTCNVTIALSDDKNRMLIVFAQRHGEWKNGTSAINQAETIVGKIMESILPAIQREHKIPKSCELVWVVEVITGIDEIYNSIHLIEVSVPRLTFLDKLLNKTYVAPTVDFSRIISPSDYSNLIGEKNGKRI